MRTLSTCLWLDREAEEAASFYVKVFPNSAFLRTTYYGPEGLEIHKRPVGSVMTIEFHLQQRPFTALIGGPLFAFSPAVSLEISCDSQEEIDYSWEKLSEDGDKSAQECGWLKDKFGLSWQVTPFFFTEFSADPNPICRGSVMSALLQMQKLEIELVRKAYNKNGD